MNSIKPPYWSKGPVDPDLIENEPARSENAKFSLWQHPRQIEQGSILPEGIEVYKTLCISGNLQYTIGLETLAYWERYPHRIPKMFKDFWLIGWRDVQYGPYSETLFVPYFRNNKVHWSNLAAACLRIEATPLAFPKP